MLNQHLVDIFVRKLRIKRGAAKRYKLRERLPEFAVLLVCFGNVLTQRLRQVRNPTLEFLHGALELAFVGFVMGKEPIEEIGHLYRFVKRELSRFAAILVEDRDLRILKDGISCRIPGLQL